MRHRQVTIDGNEAAARIAHLCNEVIAIYPITPASPMGEWADEWSSTGVRNLWDTVPQVIEMQSEAGAAGAIHGALQAGALATSFTASQGLLLMIPNMYKIAGELTPTVLHVAARSLAVQALSIFGDHSDVMACRSTGYAMLCSASVQEVQDFALIAQAATLSARIPFLHFFDGFRTSHEIDKISEIGHETARALIDEDLVIAHRRRALSPDRPVLRGTSQNPDVYFQGRESVNRYYEELPEILDTVMHRFGDLTGRRYRLFEYSGVADAERVLILMGSGTGAAEEAVETLCARGEKVGLIKVRLYRPFAPAYLLDALPLSTRAVAVLDRTKEPGADGEPLYKDVLGALAQAHADGERAAMPRVVGGRFGLSSKEFTPGMVAGVFAELEGARPKNHFTIGIHDDVSHTSLSWDPAFTPDAAQDITRCVFYGLGSDGTVSANKHSIKIIGENTELQVQGYFQYDSKKAGAVTVSHLRFGDRPIRSTYLIGDGEAQFVACHQPNFLTRYDMLARAAPGATFLLNSPLSPTRVWESLPRSVQRQLIDKGLSLHVVDAYGIAREARMGRRINTIMQACFFALTEVLDTGLALEQMKQMVAKTYGRKGRRLIERNYAAIDAALAGLHAVPIPDTVSGGIEMPPVVAANAPAFVQRVTAPLIAGRGDSLPVSAMSADGTWPLGTAAYEKRQLALEIPHWEMALCTHCGKCPLVCPHAAIRSKVFDVGLVENAPEGFLHMPVKGAKDFPPGTHISYQVAPDDCTGCGLCVEVCPIRDKQDPKRKALNMAPVEQRRSIEQANWAFFRSLPEFDRTRLKATTLKGAMIMQPLFEFSGACVGCGETPYIKLATQLFGDRMLVANATGCSSIYGGNLPTTPYTTNPDGRGPAWNNSLFEDNAEFGLGMRIAVDKQTEHAGELLRALADAIGEELVDAILGADQHDEAGVFEQRTRVESLKHRLAALDQPAARTLEGIVDYLVKKSVWLIGGDGWAYDIGYGGVDHVLASGRNVNILVLDTEVYSNTGGQTSKATPLGAVAKFSAGGKPIAKKDLAMMAMAYGNVYVAQVAYGAKDVQVLRTFLEAESYDGPSLIVAYSPCIAHGIDLANNLHQQDLAVNAGHWGLFRYDPRRAAAGENPLHLDSREPNVPYRDFAMSETRFAVLDRTHPEAAHRFLQAAEKQTKARFHLYDQLARLAVGEQPHGSASRSSEEERLMNLSTEWLGLQLGSPLVPSASPLSRSLDAAKQLEDAGAGAIVMYSLFEEAVQNEEEGMTRFLHEQDTGHAEASSYLPSHHDFPSELDRYLEQVASLKASLEIPVVASLNGVTASGWMTHAKEIAEAGADALELNAYYVAGDVWEEGHYVEQRYITLLNELREQVGIPINMKLSPFFSSIGNLVKKLEGAGVRGVSLFNRFYQPDIDVEGMRLTHTLTPTNSTDALLAMRWVAMLHGRVGCSLAATGGVHTGDDAIKLLLAGSDVVHLCQTLLLQGPQQLQRIGNRIAGWMEQQGFEQLSDFRGRLSQSSVLDPSEYERLNYIRVLGSYTAPDGVWR